MLRVRKALLDDTKLAPHPIGVSVQAQRLTLRGSVPCRDLWQRAEQRARSVLGVAEVCNEIVVSPEDLDPILAFQRPGSPWFQNRLGSGQPRLTDHTFGRPPADTGGREQTVKLFWQPATGERSRAMPALGDAKEEAERLTGIVGAPLRPGAQATDGLVRLPAIPIDQTGGAGPERAKAVLSSSSRSQELDNLFKSIDLLRQSKPAFSLVRYRLLDGVVYLSGDSNQPATKFAFAQAIALLPGVRKVILEEPPR